MCQRWKFRSLIFRFYVCAIVEMNFANCILSFRVCVSMHEHTSTRSQRKQQKINKKKIEKTKKTDKRSALDGKNKQ